MASGIYKIENLINGKIYIGSTNNLKKREYEHFRLLNNNKHHSSFLQRSYNKYGKDSFNFKIVLNCPCEERIPIEQYLIDYYQPEYNMSNNAQYPNMIRSQEWKDKIGDANRLRKYSESQKIKMRDFVVNKKPVYKICPNSFNILGEYESSYEAARQNNCTKSNILSSVNGKCIFTKGFIYCRKEDYSKDFIQSRLNKSKLYKPVNQFSLQGELLDTFSTCVQAYEKTGVSNSNISAVVRGKTKTAGGFIWSFKNKIENYGN